MAPPVAGYTAWYDASTLGLADGTFVASWADLSGNGWTLTQGASIFQEPVFYSTTSAFLINGLPTVTFYGAPASGPPNGGTNVGQTYLGNATISTPGAPGTVFMALSQSSLTGCQMASPGAGLGWSLFWSSLAGSFPTGSCWIYAGSEVAIPTSAVTGTSVITAVFSPTVAAFYVGSTSQVTGGNSGTNALAGMNIGTNYLVNQFWTGSMGEMIVYPSALSGANITAVQNYLIAKWVAGVVPYIAPRPLIVPKNQAVMGAAYQ